ncbi:MAG: Hsp70 family protein [Burkholderiaceae bacterium]|nr:MAG: Hsp70 family protein [Burkholderiaceae bacterium]
MGKTIKAYGIDLGTTNSTVAVVEAPSDLTGLPRATAVEVEQPATDGAKISAVVPSVVAVHAGTVWVGEGAHGLRALAGDPRKNIVRYRNLFYESKNEIGTSRTYAGEEGIHGPVDVAARVLAFIREAGIEADGADNIAVTVPASFQMLQREDTLKACRQAGLNVDGGKLMDEPCAAFVDYLSRHSDRLGDIGAAKRNLLVIDFGGGTCDVALFELVRSGVGSIQMKSLAVSRYHRLGGSDIDLAIVHKVLLPALVKENGLGDFDLDFEEVQARFVPALQPVAEALKIQLSNEMWRRRAFDQSEEQVSAASARFPQATKVTSKRLGRDLTLSADSSTLTGQQFDELLGPFLSSDRLAPAQFEYRLECSVFAPVEDALARSGLDSTDIHYVLSVGGSALLPQLEKALRSKFPESDHLRFSDRAEFQYAIARGAAVQAWHIARAGHGLIQPVAQDDIELKLDQGSLRLVSAGASLPYPSPGADELNDSIAVPEDATTRSLLVAFRFVTGGGQTVGTGTLDVGGARKGQRIELSYRFDENQVFRARARLKGVDGGAELRVEVQNPVSNVVNPNAKLDEHDRLIEDLRREPAKWADAIPKIAQLCAELGFHAEAITWLERYQRRSGKQSPWATNLQGIYEANRNNAAGAIRLYAQAAALPLAGGAPLFNMALALRGQGKWPDALDAVDRAIARSPEPAYRVLRLQILEKLGKAGNVSDQARDLVAEFAPVAQLNDFELGWLATAARMAGNDEVVAQVRRARSERTVGESAQAGILPTLAQG